MGTKKSVKMKSATAILLLVLVLLFTACSPKPSSVLDKMEKAYNDGDINGLIECFEPSVQQFTKGMASMISGFSDIIGLSDILPSVLQGMGMYADGNDWGTIKLKELSTQTNSDGDMATILYNVTITYPNERIVSFDETMRVIKVDDEWYIAVDQSHLNSIE